MLPILQLSATSYEHERIAPDHVLAMYIGNASAGASSVSVDRPAIVKSSLRLFFFCFFSSGVSVRSQFRLMCLYILGRHSRQVLLEGSWLSLVLQLLPCEGRMQMLRTQETQWHFLFLRAGWLVAGSLRRGCSHLGCRDPVDDAGTAQSRDLRGQSHSGASAGTENPFASRDRWNPTCPSHPEEPPGPRRKHALSQKSSQ